MKTLERTRAAGFTLDMAHTLSEIEKMSEKERESIVIPIEEIFKDKKSVKLSDFFGRLARCGVEIYQKKIGMALPVGEMVTLYDKDGFFALAEVREFADGTALKPIKQFDV